MDKMTKLSDFLIPSETTDEEIAKETKRQYRLSGVADGVRGVYNKWYDTQKASQAYISGFHVGLEKYGKKTIHIINESIFTVE